MYALLKPSLSWLLIFVPITIVLELQSEPPESYIFLFSCISIIPLAGWLGKATEHLADKTSDALGGLVNATFGNAAEFIIAFIALREGYLGVVKASLTGSIIGNILLVLGLSCFAGGIKFETLKFNVAGARNQSSMLTLAVIGLVAPAIYHSLTGPSASTDENTMSLVISLVLLATYFIGLIFSLKTHKQLFSGAALDSEGEGHIDEIDGKWSMRKSITVLVISTCFIAWMSEILVGSVEHAANAFGMTDVFIGVIVVALVGNAAEHSTAILMALKNRMDLSVGIAIGSSIQIALFVAPLLVLFSYVIAPAPMNLVFTTAELLAIILAVFITGQIAGDGISNWFEGVQLISVYLILGILFYFLPESAASITY